MLALDRNGESLAELRAEATGGPVLPVQADLEQGHGIPARDGAFGAVLVFRYLHRPLASEIVRVLRPGGLLLYETFTRAQTGLGWGPRSPEFLLEPGELPALFPDLVVETSDEGLTDGTKPAWLARLRARRPAAD